MDPSVLRIRTSHRVYAFGVLALLLFAILPPLSASAFSLLLTTTDSAGVTANDQYTDGDIFAIDLLDPTAPVNVTFDESLILDGSGEINAIAYRAAIGTYLISTSGNEIIGGAIARRRNVVEYDPVTGTASVFIDGTTLPGNGVGNIDAIHELATGNVLLSSAGDRDLWANGDVVEYNPTDEIVDGLAPGDYRIYFDESELGRNVNVDGISMSPEGNLLLSFTNNSINVGGVNVRDEDILEIRGPGNYSLWFDASTRLADVGQDLNGFAVVPEPGTGTLIGVGLALLGRERRRRLRPRRAAPCARPRRN